MTDSRQNVIYTIMQRRGADRETIRFRKWTNRKEAVLRSFHKIISIGTIALTSTLLHPSHLAAQSDTTSPVMFLELEEVVAIPETETDLYAPSLREITLISRETLTLSPATSFNQLLDQQPGIDIRTRGPLNTQSDLSIRGGSFDQSLILLNGIPMNDPQTGHFNLNIPLQHQQLQRIEILKGPATRTHGINAYSGALNLVTRPADSLRLHASLEYGQYNTFRTSATLHVPARPVKTMLAVHTTTSDGYRANTDTDQTGLYLHTTAPLGNLKMHLLTGWNKKDFGANAFYSPQYPDQYEQTEATFAALKINGLSSFSLTEATLYWRGHRDHFMLFRDHPEYYQNHHRNQSAGTRLETGIRTFAGITTATLDLRHESIQSTRLGQPLSNPSPVNGTDSARYTNYDARNHLSLSANHRFSLHTVQISGGMMLYYDPHSSHTGIYPGIDISWKPLSSLRTYFSANRSMRLPTFTDLYYQGPQNIGNPDLKPETATTFETGATWEKQGVQLTTSLFHRLGRSTIDWIWQNGAWHTRNITTLNTTGGEISAKLKPGTYLSRLYPVESIHLTYSYTRMNKQETNFISHYALDNLKSRFTTELHLSLPLNLHATTSLRYQDRNGSYLYYPTPASEPFEKPYQPFWLLDTSIQYTWKLLTFSTSVTNLLDTPYRDIGSIPMPGRWIMTRLELKLPLK